MRRHLIVVMAILAMLPLGREAAGLIYLGENSLESMLVRCPVVVVTTAVSVDEEADRAVVRIETTLKGEAKGEVTVKGILLHVTAKEKRPRFAAGDRVILFMGQDAKTGAMGVVASQKLDGEKEVKAMEGCVAEMMPVAGVLVDLANPKKEVDEAAVRAAVGKLVASENEFTKILVGRLMGTRLAERVKPEGWEEIVVAGLKSTRKELRKGALVWAGKYKTLPEAVKLVLEEMAKEMGENSLAAEAKKVLGK